MPADDLGIVASETSGVQVVLAGFPMMLADGNFGSVTFTTGTDYDGSTLSISASPTVFTTAGTDEAVAGDPVTVNDFSPSLECRVLLKLRFPTARRLRRQ